MMGVSLVCWRISVGLFYGKRKQRSKICHKYTTFLIKDYFCKLLLSILVCKYLKMFIGMLTVLAYCITIVALLPTFYAMYLLLNMILISLNPVSYKFTSFFNLYHMLSIFIGITLIPIYFSSALTLAFAFFRKPFFGKIKKLLFFLIVLISLLIISGSVEINPGPENEHKNHLSFAVWNLDSIPAREYARIPLIEALQATYNFDLFGACESSLSPDISNEDIYIGGFSAEPFRSDKPANTRNGGVCLYYKENLPIKRRVDLELLNETIVAEIKLNREKCFFVLSYRHPNQLREEIEDYIKSLENIYDRIRNESPTVTIITGDFNARSPVFWEGDAETREGCLFSEFFISNNLDELINEPTHVRDDGSKSCIDLISTDQQYLFTESGVLPSLDPHSKHNIIYGRINFSFPCPPPYKRKIWDYKSAKVENIRNEISGTDWNSLFFNLNVNEMTIVFTDIFVGLISKYVPNKIITCNDKDAPWITPKLKTAIRRNTRVYRKWVKRGRKEQEHDNAREVQNNTNKLIKQAKQTYYTKLGDKLSDHKTGPKNFWTAFKKIVNKKKYTNIPPIIENNTFISNFNLKANLFNEYFATQCKIYDNGSVLPVRISRTNSSISHIVITRELIIDIINKFNPKKAHGYDQISVAMLQLCASEISIPLQLIFQKCINSGMFPEFWKYANVQPIHKKGNRQLKTNYRPISLLPICGKILEKIIFDNVYSFLNKNDLISKNQSGFRPGDSTIYQLISITSDIYTSFENHDETRAIFLDISKAFDKVWHVGLIHKLQCNGVSGNLLNFFKDYLNNRSQRVVLNGIQSEWALLHAGVPQGSVLGPLLFLVYINDLTDNISSHMRLFADDSSLFTAVNDVGLTHEKIEQDLTTITKWAYQWKMVFNPDITKQAVEVIFSVKNKKPSHPELLFNGVPVAREDYTKHLGVHLDTRLNFSKHIREAILKASKGINLLKYLSKFVDRKVLDMCYKLYVRPHLDYGDIIYHNQRTDLMNLIEQVQYKAGLIVSGCWQGTNRVRLYDELGWESMSDRRWFRRLTLFYKISNGLAPSYLAEQIPERSEINIKLRRRHSTIAPPSRT